MKYIIVLGDGMSDEPLQELGNRTPLEVAKTTHMDTLARCSEVGLASMVPKGMQPGSDTANLSVLGYDPQVYYSGRSPLEALSIGVEMAEEDVSFRCNLVTVSEEEAIYEQRTLLDHSAGEISTEDADILLQALKTELTREGYRFYKGTSYRHLLIWKWGQVIELVPPHDILTKEIGAYLPKNTILREMMERSYDILKDHPINQKRRKQGQNPANSIWFWGAGTKPSLPSFEKKTGKKGVMVSAVDLLKGIAVGANMRNLYVEGATGGLYTNYEGKAKAALSALLEEGYDFAYIHIEAPDEMGHQGNIAHKIKAIEFIDEKVIGTIIKEFETSKEPYRMLILPDHPTPVHMRTHTGEPVPYLLYDSTRKKTGCGSYRERTAEKSKYRWIHGHELIDHLLGN